MLQTLPQHRQVEMTQVNVTTTTMITLRSLINYQLITRQRIRVSDRNITWCDKQLIRATRILYITYSSVFLSHQEGVVKIS